MALTKEAQTDTQTLEQVERMLRKIETRIAEYEIAHKLYDAVCIPEILGARPLVEQKQLTEAFEEIERNNRTSVSIRDVLISMRDHLRTKIAADEYD